MDEELIEQLVEAGLPRELAVAVVELRVPPEGLERLAGHVRWRAQERARAEAYEARAAVMVEAGLGREAAEVLLALPDPAAALERAAAWMEERGPEWLANARREAAEGIGR